MAVHNFISRLNWRHILIHFVAAWFFMYAFQTLATLHDIKLVDIFRQSDAGNIRNNLELNGRTVSDLSYFKLWNGIGKTPGLLIAFIISLIISIRKKWFWFNSFIVLMLMYILSWFGLTGWKYLKRIFLKPGDFFENTTFEFLINGLILLTLGLLTFFLHHTNKFIVTGSKMTIKSGNLL